MRLYVHIDMDCFYAAVEERENPSLKGRPIAVGGTSRRSVLCTANYEARKYGCRSAMPTYKAFQQCPNLEVLPVRFELYQEVSQQIYKILKRHTNLIETLSLDEAYLDLGPYHDKGAKIAETIRYQIFDELNLDASAGIAPNKMLAKIASDWNKPNGQFEIKPDQIESFMKTLPVSCLHGVGKKTQEQLNQLNIITCGDLQAFSTFDLVKQFGKWGAKLHELCRGIDIREIQPFRVRKSISKEVTFPHDIEKPEDLLPTLEQMKGEIQALLNHEYQDRSIKSLVIKLTFADFTHTTAEVSQTHQSSQTYKTLLNKAWLRGNQQPIRLFGIGVKLHEKKENHQLSLF